MKKVVLKFRDVDTDGKPPESMYVVCVVPYGGNVCNGVYDVHYSAKHQQFCATDSGERREQDPFERVKWWIPSAEFDTALSKIERLK